MSNLPMVISELIESVDFKRKECYVYLKNGLVLFMRGEELKATRAGLRIKDIREETIISWNSISAFKILKEIVPAEPKEKKKKEKKAEKNTEIEYENPDEIIAVIDPNEYEGDFEASEEVIENAKSAEKNLN